MALWLLEQAGRHRAVMAVLRSGPRLERVAALAAAFADGVEVLALPAWDALPYDRVAPSPAIIGRRTRTLMALAAPASRPRLLLASAAAVLQRVRPPADWAGAGLTLRLGERLDFDALRLALAERGYHWDERVDEAGEVALRGGTVELFPAADALPVRIELSEDRRITGLHHYDPVTQRSTSGLDDVTLHPATERHLDSSDVEAAAEMMAHPDQADANEDAAPAAADATPERLVPVFNLLPRAPAYWDDAVPERWAAGADMIADAYAAASAARRATPDAPWAPKPARLYLTAAQAGTALAGRPRLVPPDDAGEAVPPPKRITDLVRMAQEAGVAQPVVIATPHGPERVAASLGRRGLEARVAANWACATAGGVAVLQLDIAAGLRRPGLLLVPVGPLARTPGQGAGFALPEDDLRVGDIVVHADHGVARLSSLRTVDAEGAPEERIALEFADGAELLAPVHELDRVWRYGGDGACVPLDRIGGEAWGRKRAEIEAEAARTAAQLAEAAAARAAATAPVLDPPAPALAAFARRFPYPLTADQRAATEAALADLRSGRPMDRLVCGDVGFGKTEVALRAAAATALAGHQVLVAAPTTVLARQHLESFRRRFEGAGVRVEGLIRGGATPGRRAVLRGLRDGSVGVVVGTHGLAADGVRFARLGLVVIDEEQQFGEDDKRRLAGADRAARPHLLVMTATPIPRTMQGALVGLRDMSVIATPPAQRQPTRSFVLPWDTAVVRDALLRERRRGGQSFVVCPRIGDLDAMQARLAELAPELRVVVAHGRMKAEALEDAVTGFADGIGDVLLATNIIEAGLDIPRANLMLVANADRFGLAQLHQLRGRVGRGARRGAAYFLTEPGRWLAQASQRRLQTLETLSGLGAGAAVAAADMDLRGAGDLFGETQAGHVRAIGTELYQDLLARAMAEQRGERPAPPAPVLRTGLAGRIPEDYVPEANLRLTLYRRFARLGSPTAVADFAEELADRFGPVPDALATLLALARLRTMSQAAGVAQADLGPHAVALTPATPDGLAQLAALGTVKGERVVVPLALPDPAARVERVTALLEG